MQRNIILHVTYGVELGLPFEGRAEIEAVLEVRIKTNTLTSGD
jgi:hypothetical protein